MAWTYGGDPSKSAKDAVRFYIGDTDQQDPLLQDGEIEFLLSQYNNAPLNASIRACETIYAKFSRYADEMVGTVRIDYSQKAKGYLALKQDLQRRLSMEGSIPFAGGISRSQKKVTESNTDRVKPDFTKHMMENEQVGPEIVGNAGGNLGIDGEA